jgi:hypothetical protein
MINVGDGFLGFWPALQEEYGPIPQQQWSSNSESKPKNVGAGSAVPTCLAGSLTNRNTMTLTAQEIFDRYPDLKYLANRHVNATKEGIGLQQESGSLSASQQIFGQQFDEFDRSIQSLRVLHWIARGDPDSYTEIIRSQTEPKLTWESFESLHQLYRGIERSYTSRGWTVDDVLQAAEAALVMGDLGKSEEVRELLRPYGVTAKDHDDFYAELMQNDQALQRFRCFRQLRDEVKDLLKETSNLAHFGHITHLEGGSMMFRRLKESGLLVTKPQAVAFAWLVHTCDVGGAFGHKASAGAKVLNESTFRNMQLTFEACQLLKSKSESEAVAFLVHKRREILGISIPGAAGDTVARIGAMSRLTTPVEGRELVSAFFRLKPSERSEAVDLLSPAAADRLPNTPTYMPLMLVTQTLEVGLPILCEGLRQYLDLLARRKIDLAVRLNFNEIAGLLKTRGAELTKTNITIDAHTGKVGQGRLQDRVFRHLQRAKAVVAEKVGRGGLRPG